MTYHDLLRKLQDHPFKPFRIKLSNSTAIDVTQPGTCIVGDASAVVPIETVVDADGYQFVKNWRTITIAHIVEFADLDVKGDGRKRMS